MGGCRKLSDDEINAILAALNTNRYPLRDRALFLLGLRTGFRISELLSIRIGQVFHDGKVSNHADVARKHMKGKKEGRGVPLHAQAMEALKIYIESMQTIDLKAPLFKSRKGTDKAMTRVCAWQILKRAYLTCGLEGKLGTHSMRKSFADRMHQKLGRDIFKTQKALGHASPMSTAAYLSVNQEEIDDAILKS